jgi:hypothetical protein
MLSEKSLLALFILVLFLTIFFYPSLPTTMSIWSVLLFIIIFLRLFFAIQFRKNPEKYSLKTSYIIFASLTISASLGISLLGYIALPYLDEFYQIYL